MGVAIDIVAQNNMWNTVFGRWIHVAARGTTTFQTAPPDGPSPHAIAADREAP